MTAPMPGAGPVTREDLQRLVERVDVLEQVLENLNRMLLDGLKAYGERIAALEGAAAAGKPPPRPLPAPKTAPKKAR